LPRFYREYSNLRRCRIESDAAARQTLAVQELRESDYEQVRRALESADAILANLEFKDPNQVNVLRTARAKLQLDRVSGGRA